MSELASLRPIIPKGLSDADRRKLLGITADEPKKAQKAKRVRPTQDIPLAKTDYFRSPEMMEAVREFACGHCRARTEGNCGAHANWGWSDKAKSIKANDVVATLCPMCHAMLDQGKDLSREEREMMWLRAFYNTMLEGFRSGKFQVIE